MAPCDYCTSSYDEFLMHSFRKFRLHILITPIEICPSAPRNSDTRAVHWPARQQCMHNMEPQRKRPPCANQASAGDEAWFARSVPSISTQCRRERPIRAPFLGLRVTRAADVAAAGSKARVGISATATSSQRCWHLVVSCHGRYRYLWLQLGRRLAATGPGASQ